MRHHARGRFQLRRHSGIEMSGWASTQAISRVSSYGGVELGLVEIDQGWTAVGASLISAGGNVTLAATGDVLNLNSNVTANGNITISGANLYNQGAVSTKTFYESCTHGPPHAGGCDVATHYFTPEEVANYANLTQLVAVSGGTYGAIYGFIPTTTRAYVGSSISSLPPFFLFTETVGGSNIAARGAVTIATGGQVSNGSITPGASSPLGTYSGSVASFGGAMAVVSAPSGAGSGAATLPGGLFNTSTGLSTVSVDLTAGGASPSVDVSQLIAALPGGNALFVANPAPGARYLIETRSQYTNLNSLYGSQYLLDRLHVDPSREAPFLGDAYFDNRYVAQEILDATGKRYLDPAYVSDSQQMKALLDGAVSEAGTLGLQVGVELTQGQVAALTTDIVWYVPRTVNGETVLVPQVYLAKSDEERLTAGGSTITAGGAMSVAAGSDIVNGGTIAAGGDLSLVSTGGDIVNVGGQLSAGGALSLAAAESVITRSATVDWGQPTSYGTSIGSTASISAGTALSIQAGQDIQALATTLAAGTDLSLVAGGDLTLASLATTMHGSVSRRGYSFVLDAQGSAGSQITAGGDLSLSAGRDVTMLGSSASADGDLSLVAGGNVALAATTNTMASEENAKSGGGLMGGSKSHVVVRDETNQVSTLSGGGAVTIAAGGDLTSQGAQLSAGGDLSLSAGGLLSLLSVSDSSFRSETRSSSNAVWQSARDRGHSDTTVRMTGLTHGGTLTIAAGQGITADYTSLGALGPSLETLAKDPATAWVADLASRPDVNWQAIAEAHQAWDHKSQGLSALASAIIAIAVATVTVGAGLGANLAGVASNTMMGAAANAGMASLISQASISVINNQGDLGKVFQELGSLDTVKSIALSMGTAAAFFEVGTLTDAHFGDDPDAAKAWLTDDPVKVLENVAGHAAVGCASAAASGGNCGSGAIGAAVSGIAGSMILSQGAGLVAGTALTAASGALGAGLSGGDPALGAVTGAWGYLYNDLICRADTQSCSGVHPTKEEIDTHYADGTGWPVYAETMDPSWLSGTQFESIPVGKLGTILTNWPREIVVDTFYGEKNIGDRNIYGSFSAIRVSKGTFIWKDNYGFEMHDWNEPIRNILTIYGAMVSVNWSIEKLSGAKSFNIFGTKEVKIPGNR